MKKLIQKITDKLFRKQWTIGLARINFAELLKKQTPELTAITWFPRQTAARFFADPFLFKNDSGQLHVIFEDFHIKDGYGKISISTLGQNLQHLNTKTILNTGKHLSYPNVMLHEGRTLIMPEASAAGGVIIYDFDSKTSELSNPVTIIEKEPLLDSTILFHNGRYWLFATKRGPESNSVLYIYHSASLLGPYESHVKNPVKSSLNGSRPAGNFIRAHGQIYRPAQNCAEYYGKSVSINRVTELSESEFLEEFVVELTAPKEGDHRFGVHTINVLDDVIVFDALRRVFMPFGQLKFYFRKLLKLKNFTGAS